MIRTDTLYTYHTLPNGLRIVHIGRQTQVEYCGVTARAGSRDEMPEEEGLAHFVEHTIFKGTARRRSHHIINRMELIGGELNAFTTKEETSIYSVFPTGHTARATELIADLVINSVFPDSELDKEREVVAEEIDSYLDTPSEAVYDDFEDLIFAGSPLGHNILGTENTLRSFNSATCRRFIKCHYTPANMVFFYLGPMDPWRLFRMVEHHFGTFNRQSSSTGTAVPETVAPFALRRGENDTHQTHAIIGARIPSLYSPERHTFALLNNIIGGPGMNSRLNMVLRERRGLVYTVDSSLSLFSDCGLLSIYYGCNPEDAQRCRKLVETELRRLADTTLSQRTLDNMRRQFLGQLTVSSSSSEQTALSAARATLFHGRVREADEISDTIRDITPMMIREAAESLVPDKCSILMLG